jgi:hypothetical protein
MTSLALRTTEALDVQDERQQLMEKSTKIGYKIKQQIYEQW